MKRRTFLQFSSSSVASVLAVTTGLLSWSPRAHAAILSQTLYITEGTITQPDGVNVYFRGFSPSSTTLTVPGAQIIVQEGDTVRLTIINNLGSSHRFTIDGVVNSPLIRGGQIQTVEFQANRAGSYLYYDSNNAPYNRLSGLHGAFAIMPRGSSNELFSGSNTFKQQYSWVTHDIDPIWHNNFQNNRTPRSRFIPRYFTINGRSNRVPGHPDYSNPNIDSGYAKDTRITGKIGDRTLIRIHNAGMCVHSLHFHANHVEWIARNGTPRDVVWEKDTVQLPNNKGGVDVIYPYTLPPDAHPSVSKGYFPMHFHDEMTQTAGGGLYQFGAATTIAFK